MDLYASCYKAFLFRARSLVSHIHGHTIATIKIDGIQYTRGHIGVPIRGLWRSGIFSEIFLLFAMLELRLYW